MRRRDLLAAAAASPLLSALPPELLAQTASRSPTGGSWDPGVVRRLLPAVSDTEMLLKVSLNAAASQPPRLQVDSTTVPGRMTDTRGETWDVNTQSPEALDTLEPFHTAELKRPA